MADARPVSEPGARRGGDGDHRRHARFVHAGPPVLPILEVPDGAGLAHHQSDRLSGVEGAAAAERDDPVVVSGPECRHAAPDVGFDRVAADVREDRAVEPRFLAGVHRPGHHRQGRDPRIRHEQGALDAELTAGVGQLAYAARAEADRGGVAPVSGEGSQVFHCMNLRAERKAYLITHNPQPWSQTRRAADFECPPESTKRPFSQPEKR